MRTVLTFLSAAALLLGIGTSSNAAEKKFEKKFSVSSGGTLTVGTDVGSIKVVGSSSNEVSIVASISGRSKDVDNFEITAEQKGNSVEVHGKLHKGTFSFWRGSNLDVEFTITVPHEYALVMNTSGGNLEINDLKGEVKGETSGGNIHIDGVQGNVNLQTSGGNVTAERTQGSLHMETSGGDIRIETVTGDVEVETSGGNVKLNDIDGKIHGETSGGNISVRVKGTNKGVHVETSGGDIDIFLPKSIAANIDAETSGGDVNLDFPVTVSGKISESRVRGTINGGGNTIYAHTSGGSVRIRASE
jgi:DUF4097 and DUF4098 domain-containing protein YvlB